VFGASRYRPCAAEGQRLLAHELAHTIQQFDASLRSPATVEISNPGDPSEREAEAVAKAVAAGEHFQTTLHETAMLSRAEGAQSKGEPERDPSVPSAADPKSRGGEVQSSSASATATPTDVFCSPKPVSRADFLKERPGHFEELGHTPLDTNGQSVPEVHVSSKGRVEQVSVVLREIPIRSIYVQTGYFEDPNQFSHADPKGLCEGGKKRLKYHITDDGAQQLREGEQEHCNDYKYAFDTSLDVYAKAVNRLAKSQKRFASRDKAERLLEEETGVHPKNWLDVFSRLIQKSRQRDEKRWHTPKRTDFNTLYSSDCESITVLINSSSLPEVGKHPPAEIIHDGGQSPASPIPSSEPLRR
jgi:hypothetical protein